MRSLKNYFSLFLILSIFSMNIGVFSLPIFALEKEGFHFEKSKNSPLSKTREGSNSITEEFLARRSADKQIEGREGGDRVKNLESLKRAEREEKNYIEGEVLVKYKKNKINLETSLGRAIAESFSRAKSMEKKEDLKRINVSVLKIKDDKTVEEKIAELKNDPKVEYVQPNFIYQPLSIDTNDTYKDLLWGLEKIEAPGAWAISEDGSGVIVAVIDDGVAYNHPDLQANMWDGAACVGEDGNGNPLSGGCSHGFDYEDNDTIPLPTSGSHGTHIAGTIAAVKNNNKGIVGVAPNVKIMAVKFAFDSVTAIKGIDFSAQNGAKIINASWLCYGSEQEGTHAVCATPDWDDQAMIDAIESFSGLFVTAAGNGDGDADDEGDNHDDGQTLHAYPCDHNSDNIICVAATDQNDNLASFSDYGITSVDIGAPGANIYGTIAHSDTIETFEGVVAPNIPNGWIKTDDWGTYDLNDGDFENVLYGDINRPYANNANSKITSPVFNLDGASSADIDFYTRCDTEYSSSWRDYMLLEISGDGINFTELIKWDELQLDLYPASILDGSGTMYHFKNRSIPQDYFTNNFKIRFRWVTDYSLNNYDGCWVDDIKITKYTDGSDEQYGYKNGTSMATPHVAGLAGLIWGYNPNLTYSQVKNIILDTGDSLGSLSGKTATGKRINAYNALNLFQPRVGYSVDNVIPADQIYGPANGCWAVYGSGKYYFPFRVKDGLSGLSTTLGNFEYSIDGGLNWNIPTNGDSSGALLRGVDTNWQNGPSTVALFLGGGGGGCGCGAPIYTPECPCRIVCDGMTIVLDTKHPDVEMLNNISSDNIKIRFKANDGAATSPFAISESFTIDNLAPDSPIITDPASDITVDSDTYTIKGISEANSLVQIYKEASMVTSQQLVDDATDYEIAVNLEQDAGNIFAIAAQDAFGNEDAATTTPIITHVSTPADTTPPIITLNGSSTVSIYIGDTYTDAGATALDDVDGDITSSIVTTGLSVDTTTAGTSTITYNVSDSAGNLAEEATRTVIVSEVPDTTPPVATLSGTPSNPTNSTAADIIVAGEDVVYYKYKLDDGDYGEEEIEVFEHISLSGLSEGDHTIYVVGEDMAGNWQEEVNATTYAWTIDITVPILIGGPQTVSPTNNNTPSYTFNSSEAGTITYDGGCFSSTTDAIVGDNYVTFNPLPDGLYDACTIRVTDIAGNTCVPLSIGWFIVDTIPPVITLLGENPVNLYLNDVYEDAGAAALDNLDGDITASILVGGHMIDTATVGTYITTYNVSDEAGNPANEVIRTVIINEAPDITPPVITLNGSSTISLYVGDDYEDAGATALDDVDGDITANIVVGGDTVDTSTVGTYIITYNVSDAAGNAAEQAARTVIIYEATAPIAYLAGPVAGDRTELVITFNEALHADTLAISDIALLLNSVLNGATGSPTPISVASAISSVSWDNSNPDAPIATVSIPSTTFVEGQIVRINFRENAIKDLVGNIILNTTNVDASVLASTQIAAASTVTVNATQTEVVITSDQPTSITVPSTVTNATININPLITDDGTNTTATLPATTLNVTTDISTTPVEVAIPADTVITAPTGWNGVINVPRIEENSSVAVTPDSGNTAAVSSVIEIGYGDTELTFNKAVRLLIPGVAGRYVGYSRGGVFTKITTVCNADTQASGDEFAVGGNCKIDVGSDLVIWTKHFTKFITYTQAAIPSTSSSGGGGGGGGGYTPPASTFIKGDINEDKKVDKYDFALMMAGWGKTGPNDSDLNDDKKVDKYDFALLMANWGKK